MQETNSIKIIPVIDDRNPIIACDVLSVNFTSDFVRLYGFIADENMTKIAINKIKNNQIKDVLEMRPVVALQLLPNQGIQLLSVLASTMVNSNYQARLNEKDKNDIIQHLKTAIDYLEK